MIEHDKTMTGADMDACAWPGCEAKAVHDGWCREHAPFARRVSFEGVAFHPSMQRMDKAQAVKVLEEAAELSVAANEYRKGHGSRETVLDELADVVQTLVNLCDAYGFSDSEIADACERVQRRNLDRGRFENGERHMF